MEAVLYTDFFESVGAVQTFSFYDVFWNKYEKFALPKLTKIVEILKEDNISINLLPEKQVIKQLKLLKPLVASLKEKLSTMNREDIEKEAFLKKSEEFVSLLSDRVEMLEELVEPHYMHKLFLMNSSNDDWNDPLNDHWDTHEY